MGYRFVKGIGGLWVLVDVANGEAEDPEGVLPPTGSPIETPPAGPPKRDKLKRQLERVKGNRRGTSRSPLSRLPSRPPPPTPSSSTLPTAKCRSMGSRWVRQMGLLPLSTSRRPASLASSAIRSPKAPSQSLLPDAGQLCSPRCVSPGSPGRVSSLPGDHP